MTPLEAHVHYFADHNGVVTQESIARGHEKQGISNVYLKTKAIMNYMSDNDIKGCPFQLSRLQNPRATGLWTAGGQFDEKVFAHYSSYAIEHNGQRILTRELFEKAYSPQGSDGNMTTIGWIVPVPWSRVTSGSIDELFKYYADTRYHDEPALSLKHLRAFYKYNHRVLKIRELELNDPIIPLLPKTRS